MRIYFGTNRNPDNPANPTNFGSQFSAKGLTDLRFGWADFLDADPQKFSLTTAKEALDVGLKNAEVGNLAGQVLGSREIFEAMRAEMKTLKQDCLISVHGFNYTFEEAVLRAADLKRFYGARPMTVFLFTWPSDGSMLPFKAYASDRDDARASGVALGRGLQKFADFLHGVSPEQYCNQSVHLAAHSMGCYALRWAIQSIQGSGNFAVRRLIDQIVLFAADEDDDAFELDHKLKPLPDMAKRVTAYHNAADEALVVSNFTKGNSDRLGTGGPRNSRALPDKVTVIDSEPMLKFGEDPTGHQYYRKSETVRQDVLAVLAGTPSQNIKTRKYLPEKRQYQLKKVRP